MLDGNSGKDRNKTEKRLEVLGDLMQFWILGSGNTAEAKVQAVF